MIDDSKRVAEVTMDLLEELTPEERLDVFIIIGGAFCTDCGRETNDPQCSRNVEKKGA